MESDSEKNNIVSWYSEHELREFIDMAVRFGVDGVYKSRTNTNPYSIFKRHVLNARENYKKFDNQFHERLRNSTNTDEIGKELNGKFLTGINIYIDWYDKNKKQLEKFKPNCPYTEMLSVIEMTKREIVERFPELSKEDEVIDWIKTFNELDIEHPKEVKAYITNTIEQKKNYFSEASFNLTVQYLIKFKKQTFLLSRKRKLDYINALNIAKPKVVRSGDRTFDQTVFEAQNNYYEFLGEYRDTLEPSLPHQQTKKPEQEKHKDHLHLAITHSKRDQIAKEIINKYQGIDGKDLRILLEALKELELFPKIGKDVLFHRCCVNDFRATTSRQGMAKNTFKRGHISPKQEYIKSAHDLIFDDMLKFIISIVNTK